MNSEDILSILDILVTLNILSFTHFFYQALNRLLFFNIYYI